MGLGLSSQVQALIVERISSVVQLEILLLLYAEPARPWTAADVATNLRVDPTWTDAQLSELAAHELVRSEGGTPPAFRYAPGNADLDATVAELCVAYEDRRVSVISLIYSKPTDSLKSFADAFRIRKERS